MLTRSLLLLGLCIGAGVAQAKEITTQVVKAPFGLPKQVRLAAHTELRGGQRMERMKGTLSSSGKTAVFTLLPGHTYLDATRFKLIKVE